MLQINYSMSSNKWDKPVVRITVFLKGSAKEKARRDIEFIGYSETELGRLAFKKLYENG